MKIIEALRLVGFIIGCEAVGALGAIFTTGSVPGWYATLVRPDFAPPSWVFGPVWTTLYALMGLALYLVWHAHRGHERTRALKFFAIQLVLNGIWTPIFFGLKTTGGGLAVIILLLVSIVATTTVFFRVRAAAGWLLVPYLLWVAFATVLNFAIWQLN